MKKHLFFIMYAMFLFALTSCQRDVFSCDPDLDKEIRTNLKFIRQMTRTDMVKMDDIHLQKAAFRAFSPEQRKAIWMEKLDEVMLLNWNDEEKQHIELLQSFLDKYEGMFSKGFTEQQQNNLLIEIYRWAEYAKNTLGWNDKIINAMAGNPNRMLTKTGILEGKIAKNTKLIKTRSEADFGDCECNSDHSEDESMVIYDCGSKDACFGTSHCKRTSFGCGLFWGSPCNGSCYY